MEKETIIKKEYEFEKVLQERNHYDWPLIVVHILLQIGWFIAIYTLFHVKAATILWGILIGTFMAQEILLDTNHLHIHSPKLNLPLNIAVMLWQTMAGQDSVLTLEKDHRMRQKYADTNSDPCNTIQGFFPPRMDCLTTTVQQKIREIDVFDVLWDKLVTLQKKYFLFFYFPLAATFPASVAVYFWNESPWKSFFVTYCFPYVSNFQLVWSLNSAALIFRAQLDDKSISMMDSMVDKTLTFNGRDKSHSAFFSDYQKWVEKLKYSVESADLFQYLCLVYDLKITAPEIHHANTAQITGIESGLQIFIKHIDNQF